MSVFAVVLREPNEEVSRRLEAQFSSNHFVLSPTIAVVSTRKLSTDVATLLGITGEGRIPDVKGVVFKLQNAYAGYESRDLWEWLEMQEEKF